MTLKYIFAATATVLLAPQPPLEKLSIRAAQSHAHIDK
jgi:hypothetical protein